MSRTARTLSSPCGSVERSQLGAVTVVRIRGGVPCASAWAPTSPRLCHNGAVIDHLRAAWAELTAPGGGFAMNEIEVRGIPMRVFASAPPNMRMVWELASLHGDKPYVVYEDE